jgi:hypothetical protein
MKTWVRKTLSVGVLAAGALLFAPGGAAHADSRQITGANNGILNGTQIAVPVRVPVNIVGNSLGILGIANAQGVGVNRVTESASTNEGRRRGPGAVQATGVNNGILNGSQVYLPVNVPVNVVGNSIAALGTANSTGVGVNRVTESAKTTEGGWWGGDSQITGVNNGIANGTQIYAPIDVPINVCGNSIALLGGAYSNALCANDLGGHRGGLFRKESGKVSHGVDAAQITGANNGIANGTQLLAPISLPVNLSGNSAAVAGIANSRAVSRNESGHGDDFVQATGVNNGILNGSQIAIPINVPINVCGNSLGILGAASASAGCLNDLGDDDNWGWDGDNGHGHGHGHNGHGNGGNGGHGGQNAGDHGNNGGDYLGDNGSQNAGGYGGNGNQADDNGYGATQPATADDHGYGDVQDDNKGYNDEAPVSTGSHSDNKGGGREAAKSSPVGDLTEAVSGVSGNSGLDQLGLLNTLR